MEKSTTKFLAVLLSLALLFSFPIAANASPATYEETFTGTYTQPLKATNVLVSGSEVTVTEWYGDRVNIGKNTYSVRQNEYGLNKDGNMINASLDSKYTLWMAQYGVASIRFEAPHDGTYQFYTSQNEDFKDHNADYVKVTVCTVEKDERDKDFYRSIARSSAYNYDDVKEDACSNFTLDTGEVVFIAVDPDNNRDSVTDLTISEWSEETCRHKWFDYEEYHDPDVHGLEQVECIRSQEQECDLCGQHRFIDVEDHDCEEVVTPLGNDMFRIEEICRNCGKVTESWERKHKFDRVEKQEGCTTTVSYVCRGCNRTDEYQGWTDEDHDYQYFEEKGPNCVITYGERCSRCGKISDWYGGTYTEHEYPDQSAKETKGCEYRWVDYCVDCGKEIWTSGWQADHQDVDWDNYVDDPDHCKTTYFCKACNKYFDNYYHENTHTNYETRGCIIYEQDICDKCGAVIYEYEYDTDHNWDVEETYNKKEHKYYYKNYCTKCGEVEDEWSREDDLDNTPDGRKYYYGDCETKEESLAPGSLCKKITHIYTCTDGSKYTESWTDHCGSWEYVQVTPQHDNVCGTYNYACSECGSKIFNEDKVCHCYDSSWTKCTRTSVCTRCADMKTEVWHDEPHSFDMVTVAPTCGKNGETYYYCDTCGDKVVTATTKATGKHNYVAKVTKQPTFTSTGVTTYTCKVCGAKFTKAIAKLGKPTLTKVAKKSKKLVATWKTTGGVDGYQVQYCTSKKFKSKVGKTKHTLKTATVKGASKKTYKTPKLKKGKTYYVRVRAYKKIGKKTYYSGWTKVKKVKI